MARNRNCAAEYLVPVVRSLSTESIQILMEELDRVSESPALAGALEHCNSVTAEQKAQLHELRGTAIDHGALAEAALRSEEHMSELQSPDHLVCRLLLEKKKKYATT